MVVGLCQFVSSFAAKRRRAKRREDAMRKDEKRHAKIRKGEIMSCEKMVIFLKCPVNWLHFINQLQLVQKNDIYTGLLVLPT